MTRPALRFLSTFPLLPTYDPLIREPIIRSTLWSLPPPNSQKTLLSPKKYVLAMFPYPSGRLHLGHVRVYAISDALARHSRMRGYRVLHPMGWDAFGLPAENAARDCKEGLSPEEWTERNIVQMREQLDELGFSFDWEGRVRTCGEEYYAWTQKLFLMLHAKGWAYRAKGVVNWDPVDKTVLANEQVDAFGKSWRSGAVVEKKNLEQWFIKITELGGELLAGLNEEPVKSGWPENVRAMQSNWIGRKDGHVVEFIVRSESASGKTNLKVFTDRADLSVLAKNSSIVVPAVMAKDFLPGATAVHPLSGIEYPIIVSEDQNDESGQVGIDGFIRYSKSDLEEFPKPPAAIATHAKYLKNPNTIVKHTKYRLKDWLVSRQRRWGAPVPMIHCEICGVVPVPDEDLPVRVPANLDPISCTCPKCKSKNAKRDTDSLDTFVDSSWYFYRYTDPHNKTQVFDPEMAKKWMNVDVYVGGVEHAILHLLYARFFARFLFHEGLVEHPEPFKRLLAQGMVLGKTYKDKITGEYLRGENSDADIVWEKMSKSKHNGVDPGTVVKKFGADATRMAILFAGPPEKEIQWVGESALNGQTRFFNRVWGLVVGLKASFTMVDKKPPANEQRRASVERCIKQVTHFMREDVAVFNVAIAELMKLTNTLNDVRIANNDDAVEFAESMAVLIKLMAPLSPHFTSDAWAALNINDGNGDVHDQSWPTLESLSWRQNATDEAQKFNFFVFIDEEPVTLTTIDFSKINPADDRAIERECRKILKRAIAKNMHMKIVRDNGDIKVNFILQQP